MKQREFYYCPICGNIVEKHNSGGSVPVCCGERMLLLKAKTADASAEKHVPYVEFVDGGILVKIGKDAQHPMTPEHYILTIGIETEDGLSLRKNLRPDDKPEAFFRTDSKKVYAWEICNKHLLWASE